MTIAIPNEARNNINLRPFRSAKRPHQGETMVVTKKVEENVIPLQKFNCWWVKVPNVLM